MEELNNYLSKLIEIYIRNKLIGLLKSCHSNRSLFQYKQRCRSREQYEIDYLIDYSFDNFDNKVLKNKKFNSIWAEIGFGYGEHLINLAIKNPKILFIGCEIYEPGIISILRKIRIYNIKNILLIRENARVFLKTFPLATLEKIFILFSDPWPKNRHQKRRLIQSETLCEMSNILRNNGQLIISTDHDNYIKWINYLVSNQNQFLILFNNKEKTYFSKPLDIIKMGSVITRYERKSIKTGNYPSYWILEKTNN